MTNMAKRGRRLCAELLEDRRQLAAFMVTTNVDDANDGLMSLTEAIQTTNELPGADEINFDPSLAGKWFAGNLTVTDDLIINGLGANLTRVGGNFRIGEYGSSNPIKKEVTLSGMTISGGQHGIISSQNLTLVDSVVSDNHVTDGLFTLETIGAGILAYDGKTTIIRSVIKDNSIIASPESWGGAEVKGWGGGGIAAGGTLLLIDSSVTGNASGQGSRQLRPSSSVGAGGDGGGILAGGNVTIVRSVISGNSTGAGRNGDVGSTIVQGSSGGNGGGLAVSGTVTIIDSSIWGNSLGESGYGVYGGSAHAANGGGIYFTSAGNGSLSIVNSSIFQNTTPNGRAGANYVPGSNGGQGAGVWATGAVQIENSTIFNNKTGDGGAGFYHHYYGIHHPAGNAGEGSGLWLGGAGAKVIENSTISGNSTGRGGTDVDGAKAGSGGNGACVWFGGTGTLSILHSTIANNKVGERGIQTPTGLGGVRGQGGGVFNSVAATAVTLNHSIVALNVVGVDAPVDHSDLAGPGQFVADYSLIGSNAGALIVSGTGNQIGIPGTQINPLLGPLANNGGLTKTHALLDGSPALDAGNPALVAGTGGTPEFDQRGTGFARILGGKIDLGSFEAASTALFPDADFDNNAFVDGNDFLQWQRGAGDADGDADSDGDDLQAWADSFGQPIPPVEAATTDALVAALVAEEEPDAGDASDSWLDSLACWSIGSEHSALRSSTATLSSEKKEARSLAFQQFLPARSLPVTFSRGSQSQIVVTTEATETSEAEDEGIAPNLESEL
ncbi:MAG: hypothetical protein C0485_06405 [Pirellula sp.]|nr:hypothetical protein [Pirellula sp.]